MPLEALYVVGILLVGTGLAWGLLRGRLKSPRARAISEEAVREQYQEPERYDDARQDELKDAADDAEQRATDGKPGRDPRL